MNAEILCVGTEILLGDIINTNAAYIAKELANVGIGVYYQTVVGDNNDRLKSSLALAFSRADMVIMTGGLGPTYDDLTKETVAEYFGLEIVVDQESLNSLKEFFKNINKPMTKNNEKQALMPKGATVFANKCGTAPGLAVSKNGKTAILLPGPPSEMKPMFENSVKPYLYQFSNNLFFSKNIKMFGIGESNVEHILYDLMKESTNPTIAPYAKVGEVTLRVTAAAKTQDECVALIDPIIEKIREKLDQYIFGIDVADLQTALVTKLIEKKYTIAFAESCTGGLLSERITQIPGVSDVFSCGVCAYENSIKQSVLGVSEETLANYGAVSEQTAQEMAAGIRKISGADIAISTTGIAGPQGGTDEKPVGTVFVGIDSIFGNKVLALNLANRRNQSERNYVRHMTAQNAFFAVYELLK